MISSEKTEPTVASPLHIPFVHAMGFELLRMQGAEADIALTLLDMAMAHAIGSFKYLTRGAGECRRVRCVGGG